MFWDKKKENEGLPDLPQVPLKFPIAPPEETEPVQRQSLPSFPDSPIQKGFSQAAIKDAVSSRDQENTETPALMSPRTIEMDETPQIQMPKFTIPKMTSEEETSLIPLPPQAQQRMLPTNPQKNSDIFIKIDKYHEARRSLKEIQTSMIEIDTMLRRIRETKLREEQELVNWEKEVEKTKARVKEVVENIFEKVE